MDEEKTGGQQSAHNAVDEIDTKTPSTALDDTYTLYQKDDATHLSADEAKAVLRKIDWHLVPLLMGTYCLQYLDKSSINFASVFGLQKVN
jgi:hypothetical protein